MYLILVKNVDDDIKGFNTNSKIVEGLYYIETDNLCIFSCIFCIFLQNQSFSIFKLIYILHICLHILHDFLHILLYFVAFFMYIVHVLHICFGIFFCIAEAHTCCFLPASVFVLIGNRRMSLQSQILSILS